MQRSSRFLERTSSMARGKRGQGSSDVEDEQPERKKRKVPALASVIVEALKLDSLQKLCSSLEPILRRVVSEEVERALAKLGPAKLTGRSSPKRIEGHDGKNLQLHFRTPLSLPVFTGGKVEGEQGATVHVVLLDAAINRVVTTGPESFAKLEVVVLEGDFNNEDDDGWSQEDFEGNVVKEREGRRPLLTGDLQLSLKEGVGTLGDLSFTDNSSWVRSRKFRLGIKVAAGYCEGIRVREAKTDAFTVRDHRGELYKKHYPPALSDDVWRLEKIGKDGAFHKRLNKSGIYTVEDFLRFVVRDSQRLREVLGSGMSNKMWEFLIEHAKTCVLSGKHYVYYSDDTRNVGVVFNNIYELRGLISAGHYYSAETLSGSQKVFVDTLVKKAYENWLHVIEYDGRELLNSKETRKSRASQKEVAVDTSDYPPFNQQVSLLHLADSIPPEQLAGDATFTVGGNIGSSGYMENSSAKYQAHPHHVTPNAPLHFETTSFPPQTQLFPSHQNKAMRSSDMSLALGPPQPSSLEFQPIAGPSGQPPLDPNSYDYWSHHHDNRGVEDLFSEEDIRMRSHELLENEDMQHMLRMFMFSMGGGTVNLPEDGYSFPPYMPPMSPNYSFDEDRNRSSGKAVVGWLKLKAALRWGIFIRKKAAERRAKLVELDD